ncbi:MAG: sigma-70 family RNA polymerase sigma factor [Myxococcota bacterium]|nr:sigma-70 family RNA polymerase sigma factor [Myxococcota bacterium]
MTTDERDRELRALVTAGEIERATELAIRTYGPELVGWLHATLSSDADAQDAFSRLSEELWRSLHRFDGRCSIRTWCYMLARHAVAYVRSRPRNDREVLVSTVPSVLGAVTYVWNTTKVGAARADDVYAAIRAELDDDDQTLLVLRVDKNLSWREIAVVLCGVDAATEDVERKAATLRKQFERVKERLRALAAERLRD